MEQGNVSNRKLAGGTTSTRNRREQVVTPQAVERRERIKVAPEAYRFCVRSSTGGKGGNTSSTTTAPCNGACAGTKSICDTEKNECVECTKSDDCKADAAKPVCNTTKGACVACNENNDCKDADCVTV